MCVGLAEEQKFDYTVLEKLDGYSYDKFEKTWSYYGAYAKKYSDARLVIGIQVDGDKDSVLAVQFYAKAVDNKNETYSMVEEVLILADDTLITCTLMPIDGEQVTLVLTSNADALQAIANAKEISFKVKAIPHNSSAALAMPFPPSASCRNLDLPPVNLRFLQSHLTKNAFAIAPTHLCGIALK